MTCFCKSCSLTQNVLSWQLTNVEFRLLVTLSCPPPYLAVYSWDSSKASSWAGWTSEQGHQQEVWGAEAEAELGAWKLWQWKLLSQHTNSEAGESSSTQHCESDSCCRTARGKEKKMLGKKTHPTVRKIKHFYLLWDISQKKAAADCMEK